MPRNPLNVMSEHTPLHAYACLDQACRVRLIIPRHLLVCLGVYRFPLFDAALLYLSIKGGTVETNVRARWSFDGAVMEVVAGNRAFASTHAVTQAVWDRTFFCKMPPHCAILAPA